MAQLTCRASFLHLRMKANTYPGYPGYKSIPNSGQQHVTFVQARSGLCKPAFFGLRSQAVNRSNTYLETYLMANVGPKYTGLPMVIWISLKNANHGPHIKVSQHYGDKLRVGEWFQMTVEEEPRVIGDTGHIKIMELPRVAEFIRINKDALAKFWEQKEPVDTLEVLQELQPFTDKKGA